MEGAFFTLQDFMTFTKGVTYLLMIVALCSITGFWLFLTERDDVHEKMEPDSHAESSAH
jgi:hypothetical protein